MKQIDQILEKEMDRQEFFRLAGASLLAVIGVSGLLKNLSGLFSGQKNHVTTNSGYGSSPYGK